MNATLRIVRRNIRRTLRQNVAILALLAIPTALGVFAGIVVESGEGSGDDRYRAQFGSAPVAVSFNIDPTWSWAESPLPETYLATSNARPASDEPGRDGELNSRERSLDSVAVALREAGANVGKSRSVWTPIVHENGALDDSDHTNPDIANRFLSWEGRAPTSPGEVALSRPLADRLDLDVGDTYESRGAAAEVVGLATPRFKAAHIVFVPTGRLDQLGEERTVGLAVSNLDARSVQRIVDETVASGKRPIVASVNATDRPGQYEVTSFGSLLVSSVVSIGLLFEAALIAAAAYAIGAKRRTIEFGRLSAIGASPRQLTRIFVTEAAVLGFAGALVGTSIAVTVAIVSPALIELLGNGLTVTTPQITPWIVIVPIVATSVASALASFLPARRAAQMSTQQALANGSPRPLVPRTAAAYGVLVGLIGLGSFWLIIRNPFPTPRSHLAVGAIGVVALLISATSLTVFILDLFQQRSGRMPLRLRMAVRDMSRHRVRSLALVASSLIVLGGVTTIVHNDESRTQLDAQRMRSVTYSPVSESKVFIHYPGDEFVLERILDPDFQASPPVEQVESLGGPGTKVRSADMFLGAITPAAAENLNLTDWEWGQSVAVIEPNDAARVGFNPAHVADLDAGEVVTNIATTPLAGFDVNAVVPQDIAIELGLTNTGFMIGEVTLLSADRTIDTRSNEYTLQGLETPTVASASTPGRASSFEILGIIAAAGLLIVILQRIVIGLVAIESTKDIRSMLAIGAPVRTRRTSLALASGLNLTLAVLIAVPFGWAVHVFVVAADLDITLGSAFVFRWELLVGIAMLPIVTAAVVWLTTTSNEPAVSRRIT